MKALHRIFVPGTIGCLAVLAAASSGAFACTAQANVKLYLPGTEVGPGVLRPGDVVDVKIRLFQTTTPGSYSTVRLYIDKPSPGVAPEVYELTGPEASGSWRIPPLARSVEPYNLMAVQTNSSGEIVGNSTFPITVWDYSAFPVGTPPTTKATPTTLATPPSVAPPHTDESGPQATPAPVGGGIGSVRAIVPGYSAAAPPAVPGAAPAPGPGIAAAGVTERASADGGPPPPEDRTAPALAGLPQLPAESLWSGLDGGLPPSLLDPSVPVDQGGGPLGGILLGAGAGLLALTGLAVGLRRRQPAPARR